MQVKTNFDINIHIQWHNTCENRYINSGFRKSYAQQYGTLQFWGSLYIENRYNYTGFALGFILQKSRFARFLGYLRNHISTRCAYWYFQTVAVLIRVLAISLTISPAIPKLGNIISRLVPTALEMIPLRLNRLTIFRTARFCLGDRLLL